MALSHGRSVTVLQPSLTHSQEFVEIEVTKAVVDQVQVQPLSNGQRTQITSTPTFLVRRWDQIELLDLPNERTLYLAPTARCCLPTCPLQLRLTVEELRTFLTQQYSTYVRDPQVYVRPEAYRPIHVYVGGELNGLDITLTEFNL